MLLEMIQGNASSTELINDKDKDMLADLIYSISNSAVCVFGIITNSINLIVFHRHGFTDAINISLFALAISDMGTLLCLLWSNICMNPLLDNFVNLPFVPLDVDFLTAGMPRVCLSKVSCLITIFITVQRCLCIVLPFKAKSLLSPKRTWIVLVVFTVFIFFLLAFPMIATRAVKMAWKFDPVRNQSRLGMIIYSHHPSVSKDASYGSTTFQLISFIVAVVSTLLLVIQLERQRKWRQSSEFGKTDNIAAVSNRDQRLALMVILLSVIFIVSYIPNTIAVMFSTFDCEFNFGGARAEAFDLIWNISELVESLNASINIFLYYKMSSKYRNTLNELCCMVNKYFRSSSTTYTQYN